MKNLQQSFAVKDFMLANFQWMCLVTILRLILDTARLIWMPRKNAMKMIVKELGKKSRYQQKSGFQES